MEILKIYYGINYKIVTGDEAYIPFYDELIHINVQWMKKVMYVTFVRSNGLLKTIKLNSLQSLSIGMSTNVFYRFSRPLLVSCILYVYILFVNQQSVVIFQFQIFTWASFTLTLTFSSFLITFWYYFDEESDGDIAWNVNVRHFIIFFFSNYSSTSKFFKWLRI